MNLAHLLLRNARLRPDAPALAVGTLAVRSYGELGDRVARLADGFLRKLKLGKGERVALAMKNCPEYLEVLFACWHAGLVAVPMNAKLHAKEFAYILENSGARACFVTPDLESAIPGGMPLSELEKLHGKAGPPADARPDDPAWLFYTSGTTGVPKGAVLTHGNLLFQTHAYFADIDKLEPGDAVLHPAPLSHGSGC
jgi:long-chain acyl-CoA synthetase